MSVYRKNQDGSAKPINRISDLLKIFLHEHESSYFSNYLKTFDEEMIKFWQKRIERIKKTRDSIMHGEKENSHINIFLFLTLHSINIFNQSKYIQQLIW